MPTQREVVQNKPLAGTELKQIILNDFSKMLDRQALLNGIAAFGRCSYEITLKLHLDNPAFPNHNFSTKSRPAAANEPPSVIEGAFPLTAPVSQDSVIAATELSRQIDSPNRVRVEQAMPITVNVRDQAGHVKENEVKYPADQLPEQEVPSVVEKDISDQVAEEAGLPGHSENEQLKEWPELIEQADEPGVGAKSMEPKGHHKFKKKV